MLEMVIFDMDGVILDSERIYHDVEMKRFNELGLDISEEERYRYVGTKTTEMWSDIKQKYAVDYSVEWLVEKETAEYIACLKSEQEIEPEQGIVDLIRELNKNKVVLSLASSSRPAEIDVVLELFNLKKYFAFIVSGDEVEKGKPAPDIFSLACRRAAIPPENCIVIEDSKNGVLAAKAAGIKCVGYRNAGSGNQDLSKADRVIRGFQEVNYEVLCGLLQ